MGPPPGEGGPPPGDMLVDQALTDQWDLQERGPHLMDQWDPPGDMGPGGPPPGDGTRPGTNAPSRDMDRDLMDCGTSRRYGTRRTSSRRGTRGPDPLFGEGGPAGGPPPGRGPPPGYGRSHGPPPGDMGPGGPPPGQIPWLEWKDTRISPWPGPEGPGPDGPPPGDMPPGDMPPPPEDDPNAGGDGM